MNEQIHVHNKGIGGQNSQEGRERFATDVAALRPDYLFLFFGLNDALFEQKFLSPAEFEENLSWFVQETKRLGIKLVLCTIHEVGEEAICRRHPDGVYQPLGPNGKVDVLNLKIRAVAQHHAIPLADFAAAAQNKGLAGVVRPDGVHLTREGTRLLAETLVDAAMEHLVLPVTIVCLGDSVTHGEGLAGAGTASGDTYPAVVAELLSEQASHDVLTRNNIDRLPT